MRGDKTNAAHYLGFAREFAERWSQEADDGDHLRLAFDKAGTWSQKYNLVWDRILGLNLFSADVLKKEVAFYKARQNYFGLPLDSRKDYTKLDWTLWTATLTGNRDDFNALLEPICRFLNETPSRVPMTDWFDTRTGTMVGFQARSVVGGAFLPMLYDPAEWKKWASRDITRSAHWAPFPKLPRTVVAVPTSEETPQSWRYTTERPPEGWFKPDFDVSAWNEGPGGFGMAGTPGAVVRTVWKTSDIWLRREFILPPGNWSNLELRLHHDEDAEIYINGVFAARVSGYVTDYGLVPVNPKALAALKPGTNVLAVHCQQTVGGQYIDAGLEEVKLEK